MNDKKIITLSAPSGSGKTTIIRFLLNVFPLLSFSISATTRSPRAYEKEGVDYYFKTPKSFRQHIKQGKFLEWESVYENIYYGTYFSEINRIHQLNRVPILDLDVLGGINAKNIYKENCCSIFIYVPEVKDLRKRLLERGMPDNQVLEERLAKASIEHKQRHQFDYCISNIAIEETCKQAQNIVNLFLK